MKDNNFWRSESSYCKLDRHRQPFRQNTQTTRMLMSVWTAALSAVIQRVWFLCCVTGFRISLSWTFRGSYHLHATVIDPQANWTKKKSSLVFKTQRPDGWTAVQAVFRIWVPLLQYLTTDSSWSCPCFVNAFCYICFNMIWHSIKLQRQISSEYHAAFFTLK